MTCRAAGHKRLPVSARRTPTEPRCGGRRFRKKSPQGWEKAGTNVLEADQADTRHANTADQFRTERLGQNPLEGIRVYPEIHQNPPFNDSSDDWNLHRHACWFQWENCFPQTNYFADPEKVHDLFVHLGAWSSPLHAGRIDVI